MPLLSTSRACGSDPTTSKRRSEISEQARSGGGLGMQTSGYEGSHSSEPEEEEEEELTMVVVAAVVVTAKVGGTNHKRSSTTTLIIGSEKKEYNPKRAYAKFLYGQTYQSKAGCRRARDTNKH
jgi:hypothetical protein